jgi:hypothetical protein
MSIDTGLLRSRPEGMFERKVRLSRWALQFEKLWPRLWALIGLSLLFIAVSLAGVWPHLGEITHKLLLAAFAASALGVLAWIARTPGASREEAVRRIELRSSVPHRPASSYEDNLTSSAADDPATAALWTAHKSRLEALLAKLKVGAPTPRTDRADPIALRALLLIGVAVLTVVVGDSAADRLRAAFRFGGTIGVDMRFDAWVTPPAYTGRAPIMLADGSRPLGASETGTEDQKFEVPERSVLVVRASGPGASRLVLEVTPDGQETERIEAKSQQDAAQGSSQQAETA